MTKTSLSIYNTCIYTYICMYVYAHVQTYCCDDVGSVTLRAGWGRHHHVVPQKSFFHPGGVCVNAPSVSLHHLHLQWLLFEGGGCRRSPHLRPSNHRHPFENVSSLVFLRLIG